MTMYAGKSNIPRCRSHLHAVSVKQMTCHSVAPQSRDKGGYPALARHCLRKGKQVRHNISIGSCRSFISGSISSSPLCTGPGIWIAK
jgi:hypothetical protein